MALFGHALPAFILLAQEMAQPPASTPAWVRIAVVGLIALLMVAVAAITVVLLIVLSRRNSPGRRMPPRVAEPDPETAASDGIRSGPPPQPRSPSP
jgi:hypothetical protein